MNRLPRNLTQKPRVTRDEMEVMKAAEDVQRSALNNLAAWGRTHSDEDYKAAMLSFAHAQTLWAQATFYGTVG